MSTEKETFKDSPKIWREGGREGERGRCKVSGAIRKSLKNQYLCVILRVEEDCYRSEICYKGYSNVPGTKPGRHDIFQFYPYFSSHPSLKSGTPTKVNFLKYARHGLSCYNVLFCYT